MHFKYEVSTFSCSKIMAKVSVEGSQVKTFSTLMSTEATSLMYITLHTKYEVSLFNESNVKNSFRAKKLEVKVKVTEILILMQCCL